MEKDIKIGTIGDLDLKTENGVASATLNVNVSAFGGAVTFTLPLKISADLGSLVKAAAAAAEKASPASLQPIEEIAEGVIEQAIDKI